MIATTLKEIRAKSPCPEGWEKLLAHIGKPDDEANTDETPLPVMAILESNGLDDAVWVLDNCCNPYIRRLFGADVVEKVLPIFEKVRPDDRRPHEAIAVARKLDATREEMAAARDAARAAAMDSGRDAARDSARAASKVAIGGAASDAVWGATWNAAKVCARAATLNASIDANLDDVWGAAWNAAWNAARAASGERLKQYLEYGEAARDMPWPKSALWPEVK